MSKLISALLIFELSILFSACSTAPKLQLNDVDKKLTPITVLTDIESNRSRKIVWGGIIVSSHNLQKGSILEVLAYPLGNNYEPETQKSPLGRFILEHNEYLETVNYAAGRLVTVVGSIRESREGFIGEAIYRYPVIQAEQLNLWPTASQKSDSRFHFGIGVMFSN